MTQSASLTQATKKTGENILLGKRQGLFSYLAFVGPAVVAAVAYMDPGNFATNIQAGSQYGYLLLWVVLLANGIAMLFQSLSAKLGIVTEKSLAQLCSNHFPRPVVYLMWGASEIAAMATDLAEILGGAIALTLLFHLPLLVSALITGTVTYLILLMRTYGFRPIEIFIGGLIGVISLAYVAELFIAAPSWPDVARHLIIPQLAGSGSVLLAAGIVGATIMPHALYLHSSLTKKRIPTGTIEAKRQLIRFSNCEVLVALGIAGLVNMAMLIMAATTFHLSGNHQVADIETAYRTLTPLLGSAAALLFLLALFASGFSSSVVGTMAGQTIMQDFLQIRIPVWLRRVLTMLPAFIVIALGVDVMQALVLSQVILSLALPIPVIALVYLTSRRHIMAEFINHTATTIAASIAAAAIVSLNVLLLLQAGHMLSA